MSKIVYSQKHTHTKQNTTHAIYMCTVYVYIFFVLNKTRPDTLKQICAAHKIMSVCE